MTKSTNTRKARLSGLVRINYRTHQACDDAGTYDVFCFYPNGVWDEDKKTLSEAETAYPKDKFNWFLLSEDQDNDSGL